MRPTRHTTTHIQTTPLLPRALALLAFALCVAAVVASVSAGAQSGRRQQKPISPVPSPTPTPEAEQGESESESRPKRSTSDARVSLVVYRLDEAFIYVDHMTQDLVMESFMERLGRSKDVSATFAGKSTRKEAQERAKNEPDSFIVLFELEEDSMAGTMGGGRNGPNTRDARMLAIKTYVYEPRTGTLKYVDYTQQRPYRPTSTIGGVRIPVPVPRGRIERFPGELTLEQAARDAADRIMLRFHLRLPPDN
jgi:hypothetical protein